ncbi:MAG: hypothetical protein ACTTKC_06830 [Treponema sp.]|uniref:hypothetical protein n=1 Tax=Treponema sp. TaxID=166 RepID=UPI003FA1A7D2
MKKILRGLLLILSIFFLQSCLCPPEKLDITDCMLYDRQNDIILELNAYAEALEAKLGEPEERLCLKQDAPGDGLYSLRYKNLSIGYAERTGLVDVISTDGTEYETKRGLKVGDKITKVHKLYPQSAITAQGKYGNIDAYYIDLEFKLGIMGWKDPSMRLIITHDSKIITEISVQYDEHSM